MPTISLASKNPHKVMEIQSILGQDWTVIPSDPEIQWEESGTTFRANALIKAQALRQFTSHEVLADDSGLEVEILNGAPGVYSARYAGLQASDQNNLKKLLKVMHSLPDEHRRARFVCILCFMTTKGEIHYFEGHCTGKILAAPRGTGGFGYDSIFQADGYELSLAELGELEKNRISHRYKALREFQGFLNRR